MNRFASRAPATAAVATCPMPSSSAQVTAASISAVPMPCRRYGGSTCGESARTTGSRLIAEIVVCSRWTAPANWRSYSATTIRCRSDSRTASMTDSMSETASSGPLRRVTSCHSSASSGASSGVAARRVTMDRLIAPCLIRPFHRCRVSVSPERGPSGRDYAQPPRPDRGSALIPGIGTIVNVATVLVGSTIGVLLGNRLPVRTRDLVTDALGLVTLLIAGTSAMAVTSDELSDLVGDAAPMLIVLGSLLIGGVVGSLLRLESRVESLGGWLQARLAGAADSAERHRFIEG